MKKIYIILPLITLFSYRLSAAPGELDTSFGTNGITRTDINNFSEIHSLTLQSDGKIIAGGDGENDEGDIHFTLARYTVDGDLDTTFGTNGITTTEIGTTSSMYSLALQTDDKVIAGGDAAIGVDVFFALARYTADGILDTTFGTNGITTTNVNDGNSRILSLVVQPDGKIVVGGFATIDTLHRFALARYTADGILDTTFGTNGITTTEIGTSNEIISLVLQSDGKIVAGGNATIGGTGQFTVARYDIDGSLDTTFGTNGITSTNIGSDSGISSLVLQSDGKIVAGGNATIGGSSKFTVARYDVDGLLDTTFGTNGITSTTIGTTAAISSIALQSDDKVVAGGFTTIGGIDRFALARYTTTGILDTSFGTNGITTTTIGVSSQIKSLTLQSDGKIVTGGFAESQFALARYFGFSLEAESAEATVINNTPTTITLDATNEDNTLLTFSIVTTPEHGTLSQLTQPTIEGTVQSATVVYTPDSQFTGADSFTFKVTNTDIVEDSNTATISLAVIPTSFKDIFTNLLITKYGGRV